MIISAVITADIVNSTLISADLQKKLKEELANVLLSHKYEFYRGDSFQIFVKNPKQALQIVLQMRVAARKISHLNDIRTSIGIGQANPNLKKLNTSTDEPFILSGRAFDELAKSERRLIIQSTNNIVNIGLNVVSYFIDYLFKALTQKQSEVLFELLAENTQLKAAKKLKKSQSTINKHAQSAGWNDLLNILTEYEKLVSNI